MPAFLVFIPVEPESSDPDILAMLK